MFHLFAGAGYYPEGGMCDYIASFPNEKEARKRFTSDRRKKYYDWGHVATERDGKLVMVAYHVPGKGWRRE